MKPAAQLVADRLGIARTQRVFSAVGVLFALSLLACTVGNYEVANCDPAASSLTTDPCDKFNKDPNDCMPYQCDRGTQRCVQAPRDWDRDGFPDSRCGGTDCDDRNPLITGSTNGECSCSIAGMQCKAGQGACRRFATYSCQNNIAVCPALAGQPSDWNTSIYNDAPNGYSSEDWNCDGTVNRACCYRNSNGTEICNGCDAIKTDLCTKDVTTVCTSHCVAYRNNPTGCKAQVSKLFACNNTMCGARVAVCTCTTGGVFGLDCLLQTGIEERLRCR